MVNTKDFPKGVNEVTRPDGTVIRRKFGHATNPPIKATPCPWLGSPREGDVLVAEVVCGCKANRTRSRKSFIVHDCAIRGRCIPGYTCQKDALEIVVSGDWEGAEPCKFCPSNPANQRG